MPESRKSGAMRRRPTNGTNDRIASTVEAVLVEFEDRVAVCDMTLSFLRRRSPMELLQDQSGGSAFIEIDG
jgi:hypothetical protein